MRALKGKLRSVAALTLCLALALSLAACSGGVENEANTPDVPPQEREPAPVPESETYVFTDSTGREVELPRHISRVASAGPIANIMLYAVKPEVIVGWSSAPSDTAKKYIAGEYRDLPEYGRFYGNTGDFNREALMAGAPEVIIDIGEWDGEYKAELDALQEQIGIPVILIEENLEQTPAAYRTLGRLLEEEERAEKLAAYCEEAIADAKARAASIPEDERVRIYYAQGDGLSTMLSGTIHAQIYELIGGVVVADAGNVQVQQGGGTVSMEQLLVWDPDVIMFAQGSIYDTVSDDPTWAALSAIRSGKYYEIPVEPYNWLGRPPGPNRVIGIRWLGNLIYPELFDCDIEQEVRDYFSMFYRYDLSDGEVAELLGNSTLKAATVE